MVYIGVGSNLGNRIQNIEKAKYLINTYGIKIVKSSSYYETSSWPDPSQPKFINIIIQSNTKFTPKKYLDIFKAIEKKLGRKKSFKNAPRTCDIDLISYFKKISKNSIIIPHKRMHKRNFVLLPLYELDKNWSHPITNQSIKELIFSLPIKDITSIKQI
jgi:2-amino-4-hydroxy-6-hydroxymethyldihydropteridine diphosphokinase